MTLNSIDIADFKEVHSCGRHQLGNFLGPLLQYCIGVLEQFMKMSGDFVLLNLVYSFYLIVKHMICL